MQNFLIEDGARGRTAFGPARPARSRTNRVLGAALVCGVCGLLLLQTQAGGSSLAMFTGMPMGADTKSSAAVSAIPASTESCRSGTGPTMFIY
jgi:hypothetical protein